MSNHHHHRPASSTAPTRPHTQRDLFAPTLLRRPTSRTTPRVEDEILTDPVTSDEEPPPTTSTTHPRRPRKPRNASPTSRPRTRVPADRGEKARDGTTEFVNRQPDGGYLLGISAARSHDDMARLMYAPEMMEAEAEKDVDAEYAETSRTYFTSGAALKATRRQEEGEFSSVYSTPSCRRRTTRQQEHEAEVEAEYATLAVPIMARLRQQAMGRLEAGRWMFGDLAGEGIR